jgi:ubiquinone/menaquinone biosynthesis C-methylase UbiE
MPRAQVRNFRFAAAAACLAAIGFVAFYFPYATDAEPSPAETARTVAFYQQAYTAPTSAGPDEDLYVSVAAQAAKALHVEQDLREFVAQNGLQNAKVLEVGAGQGALQDLVADYTGLDISPTVQRFFHKPFVLGSATALPFPDNRFDATWSIFVLEHIPTPEQALREMRRVTRDGGYIYLYPAWSCSSWKADGYEVRPYSDFNLTGKLVKASIPIRSSNLYHALYTAPIRVLRFISYAVSSSPTRLHYLRLTPNYEKYWMGDSDAASSIDRYEALLWFESRGDECVNCRRSALGSITESVSDPRLIIRVRKH